MDADPPNDSVGLQLLVLALLILCNAFFAASEMAVITLNDTKIQHMAEAGHKKARMLLRLTADSSRFLATIQIGVTLAGFLASAFAASNLSEPLAAWLHALTGWSLSLLQNISTIAITLLMSYFSLVFGELVPKQIAIQKAEALSFAFSGVLRAVSVVFSPFVRFLSASTNLVVRLLGFDPHADKENVTEEGIRMMVDVGEENGVIEEAQKDMINNIFEFDDITAGDIMTPRTDAEMIEADAPVTDALRIAVDGGFSRVPVYEEDTDHVVGVLHVKDLLSYVGKPLPKTASLRRLIRPTCFVPETKKCGDLFTEMTAARMQMAMVVDEYGGLAGIVTMEDLLESIVGNIQDEYDHEEQEVTPAGENAFDLDASLSIDDVSELLHVSLPEGDYDTLAGFLMDQLGRIPEKKEQPEVVYENLVFRVLSMDDRRIDRVHVAIKPATAPEEEPV